MVIARADTASVTCPSSEAGSLVDILQWRAAYQPDQLAYIFLTGAPDSHDLVTYGDLDRSARSIAARLGQVASPGDRAMLFYPSGPDFVAAFMGCLYAGVIAVPLYPPRANRSSTRLDAVLADSGATLALTQTSRLPEIAALCEKNRVRAEYLLTNELAQITGLAAFYERPPLPGIAYLQYTSGSTSTPKGVMVTHANLVYNCGYMCQAYGHNAETVAVTWLPHFHDMGLIEGLLNPPYLGYPTAVLSPAQFVQRPLCWLEAVSEYQATHSGAPNFAFDLCVNKIRPEQRDRLDLSSWEVAYCGAEPVRSETMSRFAEYFAPAGFDKRALYPCYGLAEATLMVSGNTRLGGPKVLEFSKSELKDGLAIPVASKNSDSRSVVGCGYAFMDMEIAIVDPAISVRCPHGVVGEIWVGGPTNAAGYWRRPEETADTFAAYLADGRVGPFMRTGDLGFLWDDELFVVGRLKDLIIIRGGNFYPQDIELVAERTHPALRLGRSAAFSIEVESEERLVVAVELERHHRKAEPEALQEVANLIRQAVSEEFDLDTYCVQLLNVGGIHMTSSGKVQRQSCRADFIEGKLDVVWESMIHPAPHDRASRKSRVIGREALVGLRPNQRHRAIVTYLRELLADMVGLSVGDVAANQPLGTFGIDSLKGNELTATIEQDMAVRLSSTLIWNHPTIAQIAHHIAQEMGPHETPA
ncbi:MAG: AMP-binding protein [Actinomycetota bacterium]